jgi:iron complex outermembrane receptor protein
MNRYRTNFIVVLDRAAKTAQILSHLSSLYRHPKKLWFLSTSLTLFWLLSTFLLFAQGNGTIAGTVLDTTGAAVSGAAVTATRVDTGRKISVVTDGSGNYAFSSLPPAHYSVKVAASGFQSFEEINLVLESGQTLHVDAKLKVGSRDETIQVEASTSGNFTTLDSTSSTRTNTPLIEVPQSVEVVNYTLIQDQDRRTLADALVNVSGVTPTKPEEILFTQPLVRGFPAEIYTDGLSMFGNTTTANDPTGLVGVERVDVIKGPNSTMYGGGLGSPLGGLINVVSVRPESISGGYVGFRGGDFGTVNLYGYLNLSINERIAARLSGEYQRNDSWVDVISGDRWSVQPAMSFQLGRRTDLFVQGRFNHRDQLEYSGIPADEAFAGRIDRDAFAGAPVGQPHTKLDNVMATTELNHAFSDAVRWTTSARYYFSQANEHGSFVLPGLSPPDPDPPVYQIFTLDMPSNPVREGTFDTNLTANLRGLGGRHLLLAGVSYDHTNFFSEMGFSGVPVGEENLAHPTYDLQFGPGTPATLFQTDRYQTTAVYGQDQTTYGRLGLTGSVRYTRLNFREREQGTNSTYNHASGRIGGDFKVANGVALYAAYATAFRGAFGLVVQEAPKPETSQNVEGGLKLALSKAHLAGTFAIFNQIRDNVATSDPTNFLYSIQTGQQRARGAEADLTWEPIPAISLLANYAYTQATVTKDNTLPVGDFLARVPRNSGRVAGRYRLQNGLAKGLAFGAGVTAFSQREITLPNTLTAPGYAAVDAQASYDFGRYTLQGSATNLTARKTFDSYEYFGFPVVMPNQPISGYITLRIQLGSAR